MAKSNKKLCIGVKTIVDNGKRIITFRCFSDGVIEKHDHEVPKWVAIGNGKGAAIPSGECIGFSIHMSDDNKPFIAVRWFKNGNVQIAYPGPREVWQSL
ncbi:hypothetical protein [Winogradskyella sp.]|uniref:hypothetical protein n=1 Tax=Winogradskyella sp. TaxID=1883156 RepID=UPI003BAA1950